MSHNVLFRKLSNWRVWNLEERNIPPPESKYRSFLIRENLLMMFGIVLTELKLLDFSG